MTKKDGGWSLRTFVGGGLVLAAIGGVCGCPGFVKFPCRSKQSEARDGLKRIVVAEYDHHVAHGTYTTALALNPRQATPTTKVRYRYRVVSADADHFVAEANGFDDMQGDVWRIDEQARPVSVVSVCPVDR